MEGSRLLIIFGFLFVALDQSFAAVTMEQMMSAGKLMRDVCQPKFPKIPVEVLDNIKNGAIPDDKDGKCYINCIMEMMQAMKKGKFNYETSIRQIDLLVPDEMKDDYKNGLTACKGSIDGIKNHCDAAHGLLHCLKKQVPKFLFP